MKRQVEWFQMDEPHASIGFHPYDPTDDQEAFLCPLCGKRTELWTGTIYQDEMGNDIEGYCYDCYDCKIHSATEEIG